MAKYLTRLGVNVLVHVDHIVRNNVSGAIAAAILMLQNYNPSTKVVENFFVLSYRDVFDGCERSLLKFYMKQIPCDCLDKRYLGVKETWSKKTSVCHTCKERYERSEIYYCTHCEVQLYCSRKCQEIDWDQHKGICKKKCMELPLFYNIHEHL